MVTSMAIPTAIDRSELIQETKNDVELNEVIKMLRGEPYKACSVYERIKSELSLSKEGLVLRGTRIVIPSKFKNKVIQIAHGGHLGIVKTKQLIRSHVWFPGIDFEVEKMIKSCPKCQVNIQLNMNH